MKILTEVVQETEEFASLFQIQFPHQGLGYGGGFGQMVLQGLGLPVQLPDVGDALCGHTNTNLTDCH
ncbi:hypothetical protein H9Q10_01000 [Eikenella sp. S3360]|uniref:Uncharacterized protein n=1 Tax=Eikenella glucosivorans TaxID=2766967 RepID=A0ABS0N7H6_9NEIS|nr:hypothetical protein [Eikenella glucosivorans]MBH5328251.1 hypothetical protein [Eikenella glucosivorans]